MDKLKKCMTVMAVAGTVLVTVVFCYMPFREIIKEAKKDTVSVGREETFGDTDTSAEDLHENMTRTSQNNELIQDVGAQQGMPAGEEILRAVLFEVKQGSESFTTYLYKNIEGICYVFLPGFAKDAGLQVEALEDGGWITIGEQRLAEGDVLTGIAYEQAYEFVLYDKEGQVIENAPLFFMHSSQLPVISLQTESESMEFIHSGKEAEERGELRLYGVQGELLYEGSAKEISGRGNSTFGLLKKSYSLSLDKEADLFGFGKSKNYNLMADGYDETKLRNRIVFDMARVLGMEYVPEGQSVDLYCNGVYYGVYYLCEKVEIDEERLAITDMEENTMAVYSETELEKIDSIASQDGMKKWTDCEVKEADITGGYLFEREIQERYAQEMSGFITNQEDAYVLKSPRYATREQVDYVAGYMQEFQDAVEEADGVNKQTGKHYSEYIDMNSFVAKYLVEEVSRNYDGGVTSSFFYKKPEAEGGKLYAGPVWDYDVTFGNCALDKIASNPIGVTKLNDHLYSTSLFADLYEQEDFYAQVVTTYEQKVRPYLANLLETGIDVLSAETRQAVRMDNIRWNELKNRHQYYKDYDTEIRYLKYYIENRMNFLDEVWLKGEVYHSVSFVVDGYLWKKYYVKDGELPGAEPHPTRYNSLFMGWYTQQNDVAYDEFKPVFEDVTYYAMWQQLPETEVILTDGLSEQ